MMRVFFISIALLALTGCASALQQKHAQNYTILGAQAQAQGNWDGARRAYARAVVNAEAAKLPAKNRAILTYEYGRSLGVTCFYDLAEAELTLAYTLDKEAGNPLYYSLTELARLMLAQQKLAPAASYYEQTLKALDLAKGSERAPIEYAVILDEYAQTLTQVGRNNEAKAAKQRSATLIAAHPGQHSITDRTPYGTACTKK